MLRASHSACAFILKICVSAVWRRKADPCLRQAGRARQSTAGKKKRGTAFGMTRCFHLRESHEGSRQQSRRTA
jgi:hypothetical protein